MRLGHYRLAIHSQSNIKLYLHPIIVSIVVLVSIVLILNDILTSAII